MHVRISRRGANRRAQSKGAGGWEGSKKGRAEERIRQIVAGSGGRYVKRADNKTGTASGPGHSPGAWTESRHATEDLSYKRTSLGGTYASATQDGGCRPRVPELAVSGAGGGVTV